MSYDVVIPTTGRPSLARLLGALAVGTGPGPRRVFVIDDRPAGAGPLELPATRLDIELLRGRARGPAAARNTGWRAAGAVWVAFLDDDVIPPPDWRAAMAADLAGLPGHVAASQGRVVVPLPADRRPTDWERNVAGLEDARWATADMAYRRSVLGELGGFDERFPRAYREDADLGLRTEWAGLAIARGRRHVLHPPGPAGAAVSIRLQAGNADDALMDALHGPEWRERARAPRGRFRRQALTTAAGAGALVLSAASAALAVRPAPRRRPSRTRRAAAACGALWLAGTAELAWARIAPGPRSAREVATMAWTSAVLPPAAVYHRLRGRLVHRSAGRERPAAVLLDRDGTLVEDVPYNGDPERVRPVEGARAALDRLRDAGLPLAVISNQSGIGRGLLSRDDVEAVNRRVEQLVGPIAHWLVCPHAPGEGCTCRKPRPGLVLEAAERLGVEPARCAVIGDIGADVEAARAAGARALLVPTVHTRAREIETAPEVASTLSEAVERLLA